MIEVLFSDSACGSFKCAQRYGAGEYPEGCIGVIVGHSDGTKPTEDELEAAKREAEKKARLAWENATPLGGNSADIYGFNLMLSVGDISENHPGIIRQRTMERLYSIYPNDEGRQAAIEILKWANENLNAVRERAEAGESIRVWYSNQPDEMCGFCWFMNQLKMHDGQVFTVKLPEWEADDEGNIVQKIGWGELAPEEWYRYLALQKPVPPVLRKSCAAHWQKLQEENAPLRAVMNGRLVSTSEKLYDDFILREIAVEGEEFQEAMIIGRVLGKYQLGIGDHWIASRIEEMIHAGMLEVVSAAIEDMPIYHRVLRKRANRI